MQRTIDREGCSEEAETLWIFFLICFKLLLTTRIIFRHPVDEKGVERNLDTQHLMPLTAQQWFSSPNTIMQTWVIKQAFCV